MGRLTEANYRSRRLKLQQHIEAAKTAWHDAAFRVEVDGGEQSASDDAKGKLDDLEARLSGLDGAWQRELEMRRDEVAHAVTSRRIAIAQEIADQLAARKAAAGKVQEHLSGLIESLSAMATAERAAGTAVGGVHSLLTPDQRATMGSLLASASFNLAHAWCDSQIAGRLMRAGFDLSGLNWATASWQSQGDDSGLERHCEAANTAAVGLITRALPEVWQIIHGEDMDGEG